MAMKKRQIGGGTVAKWKKQVLEDLAHEPDEAVASAFNRMCENEGYDFRVTPQRVEEWRRGRQQTVPETDKFFRTEEDKPEWVRVQESEAEVEVPDEGEATKVLRDLVRLLGRKKVHDLVDEV